MKLFSMDSKLFRGANKILDIMYLNFLWLVFSIPLITIGAATTAAYYVSMKMVNDEEGYIGRTFVRSFKENFRQSTIVWIVMVILGEVLYVNYQLLGALEHPMLVQSIVTVVATFIYIVVFLAVFPLLARYDNSIKQTIRNSYMITVRHFAHTLGMLLILTIFVLIFWTSSTTIFFGILIGPGLLIYIASSCYLKIFQKVETSKQIQKQVEKELEEERRGLR